MLKKDRILYLAAAFFIASVGFCLAGPLEECAEYAKLGIPGSGGDLLCRKGYLLAHSPENKTPFWVIEHLTAEKAGSSAVKREAGKFAPDPDLEPGNRSELRDYKGSGYDRGHMAPATDMKWDAQAMKECFYLSNMTPQVGKGMNQDIWRILEGKVRKWAIARDELYIFTGPVYKGQVKIIGKNKVAVPSHIYKIVYDPRKKEAIAFMMPNRALATNTMPKYLVSIRDIEKETGLDFLSDLDNETQNKIETVKASHLWN